MVNIMDVNPDQEDAHGLSEISKGYRLLIRVVDSHVIIKERLTPLLLSELLFESIVSRTFRKTEFSEAVSELVKAELIEVVIVDGIKFAIPKEKLIVRYDGTRKPGLFSIQ
jgi:hypothetical protein